MIAAVILDATAPMTATDAERAFAADGRKLGQWTPFRNWVDTVIVDRVAAPPK